MTLASLRTSIATLLKGVAGVHNVYEEDHTSLEPVRRTYGNAVHFWHISAQTLPADDGLGWYMTRREYTIRGFFGVALDGKPTARKSDVIAKDFQDLVVRTFTDADNRKPGGSCFSEVPVPLDIARGTVEVPDAPQPVPVHVATITWIVEEE